MPDLSLVLPESISALTALILVLASFLSSGFTAAFGIGGGVSLLALMGFLLPVGALVPVHGVVQLGSNFGRTIVQRRHIRWMPLFAFAAGTIIGAMVGVRFVFALDDAILKILLGLFIILIVWFRLPSLKNAGPRTFGVGGLATGVLTMLVGATGPFVIALFEKTFDERRHVVATHAAAMVSQHAFKIIAFGFAGFAFHEWLALMVAMVTSGFIGTLLGSKLLDVMPETNFRIWFKWVMTVLGAILIFRGGLATTAF